MQSSQFAVLSSRLFVLVLDRLYSQSATGETLASFVHPRTIVPDRIEDEDEDEDEDERCIRRL
jgi:hypothetical protein